MIRKFLMPVNFVVWQFVRIMVCLEQQVGDSEDVRKNSVLSAWRGIWRELDSRLAELGQSDTAAYADLMMEQEVVIDEMSASNIDEVIVAIDNVSREISTQLNKTMRSIKDKLTDNESDAKALVESLDYEVDELNSLRGYLTRRRKSPSGDTFH
jgi:hypothetical protein